MNKFFGNSIGFLLVLITVLGFSSSAMATSGDFYAKDTLYRAATYSGHPNYFGSSSADYVVDINANAGDDRRPVYAPENGSVAQVTFDYGGGWGNSIIWTSADGREKIHVGHLDQVVKTGNVRGGDLIAYSGNTGKSSGSHLHVSRKYDGIIVPVVLSGHQIVPAYWYDGNQYSSSGPVQDTASVDNPPTGSWVLPGTGTWDVNFTPGTTKLKVRAADDKGLSLIWFKAYYDGDWHDLGQGMWVQGTDQFERDWFHQLPTSQVVTLRAEITDNGGHKITVDRNVFLTEEQHTVAGDFNGDGKGDLARFVADTPNDLSLWLFQSTGERFNVTRAWNTTAWAWNSIKTVAGDFDGDGKDEIAAIYNYGDSNTGLWVFKQQGNTFTVSRPWLTGTGNWSWYDCKPSAGDYDGDGKDELAFLYNYYGWNNRQIGIWVMDVGNSSVENNLRWTMASGWGWDWSRINPVSGNFDGDNRDELGFYFNYSPGGDTGFWSFKMQGTQFNTTLIWRSNTGWCWPDTKTTAGDFDGDGKDELGSFYKYNDGPGLWIKDRLESSPAFSKNWWVTAGWGWDRIKQVATDADGDGKAEIYGLYDYGKESFGVWTWRPDKSWAPFRVWFKGEGTWTAGQVQAVSEPFADKTTPVTGLTTNISPLENGWYNTKPNITLTRNEAGTTYFRWDQGSWQNYSNPIVAPEGSHTLSYYSRDNNGNAETVKTKVFRVDTLIPAGTLKIKKGARYTNSVKVALNLTAVDSNGSGVVQMMLSSTPNFANSRWVPYLSSLTWYLLSGDGNKTVYVKLKDQTGNVSNVITSNIFLDTVKPTVILNINNGQVKTSSSQVTLTIIAKDNITGTAGLQMLISNRSDFSGAKWLPYTNVKRWTLTGGKGVKRVYIRVKDQAGNVSNVVPAAIRRI